MGKLDQRVARMSMRTANGLSRRSFITRAATGVAFVAAGPTVKWAMFPDKAWAVSCGVDQQAGESVLCDFIPGRNLSTCASTEANCGSWIACPDQRGKKCNGGPTNQYCIQFTDCCNCGCGCGGNVPADPYGNGDSCQNPAPYQNPVVNCNPGGSGSCGHNYRRVVCRYATCQSTTC